jgi:hypothetical protein
MECPVLQNNDLVVSSEDQELQTLVGPVVSKVGVRNSRRNRKKSNRTPQLSKRVTRSMQRACRHMVDVLICMQKPLKTVNVQVVKNFNKFVQNGNESRSMNGTTDCARSDADSSENAGRTDVEIEDIDASLATATDMPVKEATLKDLNASHVDMPLKEKTQSRKKSLGNNVSIYIHKQFWKFC